MEMLIDLITNPIFDAPACAWLLSQVVKIVYTCARDRVVDLEHLTASGGMPSSHTATVTGLLVSTLLRCGTGGFEFPMALFFSIIVIYDALGVRYETGEQGKVLNHLIPRLAEKDGFFAGYRRFKEKVGHTLPEVLVGAVIGITSGILCSLLLP